MRFGAVGGFAVDLQVKTHHAFVRAYHLEVGRLGNDRCIDLQVLGQVLAAGEEGLLVYGAGIEDGPRRLDTRFFEALDRVNHRRAPCLGIAGAAAVEQAVADMRLEGRDGHHFGRGGIHVALEEHGVLGVFACEGGDDITASGQDFAALAGDVQGREERGQVLDHAGLSLLTAGQRRVDAVDGDEILQGREDLVIAAGPFHLLIPHS